MNLRFEIINQKIRQKTNFEKQNEINCLFKFITSEWGSLEKYIIFWNEKNKSIIQSLGKEMECSCQVPEKILEGDYFSIQIYSENNLSTNKIKIDSFIESEECPKKIDIIQEPPKEKCRCHEGVDTENYIIDNVKYKNNKILFYSDNKLIKSIDILDVQLLEKIKNNLSLEVVVDTVLSETSENPVMNKTIYNALLEFLKASDLATIALTGDYNDLKNIPTEFNPTYHNHHVVDVVDYEENINVDLNALLDVLGDEIAKE